jgi:excinuclease ABC subunit C
MTKAEDPSVPPPAADDVAAAHAPLDILKAMRLGLPDAPGVYRYLDARGKIIYVGKAKSLKKRVNSYFTKNAGHDFKTRVLVGQIRQIEYTVTSNDLEALLLENNLIKELQPRYNLMLKDGKSYPFIAIKAERFPRVFPTRQRIEDGTQYYGPYPNVATMNTILRFIRDNFKLRTCNLSLTEANIQAGKFRACLEYQIGKCQAPCVALQDEASYNDDIRQVRQLLRGHFRELLGHLENQMQQAVAELKFERAHYLKNRIEQVRKHRNRSTVVSEKLTDLEVVAISRRDELVIVNHFKVEHGAVVRAHAFDVRPRNDETDADILLASLARLMAEDTDFRSRVLTNAEVETEVLTDLGLGHLTLRVPQRGDEKKLVDLALENGQTLLSEKIDRFSQNKRHDERKLFVLKRLAEDLRMGERLPQHIECFDNSNFQGASPVSSCVVFRGGLPTKREYRAYHVKTVTGIDDFATMYEVVHRRYRRLLDEQQPLPDLILIDGGKGQLGKAVEALRDLNIPLGTAPGNVTLISIAKRLEEIYVPGDPVPLYIDKKSPALKLLQHLRNEAHNHAITFHRKSRDRSTLRTELTEIPGIGPKTAQKLLQVFGSVTKIRAATDSEIIAAVGKIRAQQVLEWRGK